MNELPADAPDAGPPETAAAGADPDAAKGERIAKRLARAGLCSRRDAERWIAAGRVTVDGARVDTPATLVTEASDIRVDGARLEKSQRSRLWLYHKPVGLVVTHRDPEGRPTVFDRLPKDMPRVMSVGRLDLNSEGLLLLTNDGELARRLELPSSGLVRRYRVRAHGEIDERALERLRHGVTVEGVAYGPIMAAIERQQRSNLWLSVALKEGKNREVRRVMAHLGLGVNRLIRIAFGPFTLDALPEGEVVEASPRLVAQVSGDSDVDAHGRKPGWAKAKHRPSRKRSPAGASRPRAEERDDGGRGGPRAPRDARPPREPHGGAGFRRAGTGFARDEAPREEARPDRFERGRVHAPAHRDGGEGAGSRRFASDERAPRYEGDAPRGRFARPEFIRRDDDRRPPRRDPDGPRDRSDSRHHGERRKPLTPTLSPPARGEGGRRDNASPRGRGPAGFERLPGKSRVDAPPRDRDERAPRRDEHAPRERSARLEFGGRDARAGRHTPPPREGGERVGVRGLDRDDRAPRRDEHAPRERSARPESGGRDARAGRHTPSPREGGERVGVRGFDRDERTSRRDDRAPRRDEGAPRERFARPHAGPRDRDDRAPRREDERRPSPRGRPEPRGNEARRPRDDGRASFRDGAPPAKKPGRPTPDRRGGPRSGGPARGKPPRGGGPPKGRRP